MTTTEKLVYLEGVSTLRLDRDGCIGCALCTLVCPHAVFLFEAGKAEIHALDRCMECGACSRNCPVGVLQVKAGVGCASAIIHSWLTGEEPSCDCGGASC